MARPDKDHITIEKHEGMNPTCNVCCSYDDVYEILLEGSRYGTAFTLCKRCRDELTNKLIALKDNK